MFCKKTFLVSIYQQLLFLAYDSLSLGIEQKVNEFIFTFLKT